MASTERSWISAILRLGREGTKCPSASKEYCEDASSSEYAEEEDETGEGRFGPQEEDITGF
jgi:hypothetical protein